MDTQESLREVANLRLRFQMNQRLRLESLAALSKVFREYGEPIRDELLANIVPAIPEELPGIGGHFVHASSDPQGGPPPSSRPGGGKPSGGPPPTKPGGPPPTRPSGGPPPTKPAGGPPPTKPSGGPPPAGGGKEGGKSGAGPKKRGLDDDPAFRGGGPPPS